LFKTDLLAAPRNETEQTIAGIWQELLGIEPIGVHDNFFELGGQSLLATQVVARVRTALKTDLPLRRFFEEPTVAELAHAILPEKNGQSSTKLQESAAIATV
jgi:phthiocerol/phenolphthiocerol synthesis type-I polyketide synthase E